MQCQVQYNWIGKNKLSGWNWTQAWRLMTVLSTGWHWSGGGGDCRTLQPGRLRWTPLQPHFFVSKRIRCKLGCKNRETILPPLTRPLWPLAGPRAGGVVRTPPVVSAACQDDEDLCAAGSGGGVPPLGSDWTPPGQGPPSQGQQANGWTGSFSLPFLGTDFIGQPGKSGNLWLLVFSET